MADHQQEPRERMQGAFEEILKEYDNILNQRRTLLKGLESLANSVSQR